MNKRQRMKREKQLNGGMRKNIFDRAIEFIGQTPINEVTISSKLNRDSKPSLFNFDEVDKDLVDILIDLMETLTDGSVIPSRVELILPSGTKFRFFDESDLY